MLVNKQHAGREGRVRGGGLLSFKRYVLMFPVKLWRIFSENCTRTSISWKASLLASKWLFYAKHSFYPSHKRLWVEIEKTSYNIHERTFFLHNDLQTSREFRAHCACALVAHPRETEEASLKFHVYSESLRASNPSTGKTFKRFSLGSCCRRKRLSAAPTHVTSTSVT